MSYNIDHQDSVNYPPLVVDDQQLNTDTSLTFVGKNYTGYSQFIAENFLHLLENFARPTPPGSEPTDTGSPIPGQLWYNTGRTSDPAQPQLLICDESLNWVPAGNVHRGTSQPTNATLGDLWVDTSNQQLSLWSGSQWILVGPQFSAGAQTGPYVGDPIPDTTAPIAVNHNVIKLVVADEIVAIISKDAFTPKSTIDGFATIKQGINISTKDFDGNGTVLNKLWGTAETASSLLVGNTAVASTNFLRSDIASVTNYGLETIQGSQ